MVTFRALLRINITRSSFHISGDMASISLFHSTQFGKAKISHFGNHITCEKYVGGFDITMYNGRRTFVMQVFNPYTKIKYRKRIFKCKYKSEVCVTHLSHCYSSPTQSEHLARMIL